MAYDSQMSYIIDISITISIRRYAVTRPISEATNCIDDEFDRCFWNFLTFDRSVNNLLIAITVFLNTVLGKDKFNNNL